MACASECGEGINPVPTATLQEARDATSWRGGTTDALWFQTMVTTLASSSWTHIAEISPWSIWMGGLYMARPARRRTQNIKTQIAFF